MMVDLVPIDHDPFTPAPAGSNPAAEFDPHSLLDVARQQYPVLGNYDIGYKYSPERAPFMMESWGPGVQTSIPGVDRPSEFAPNAFGVEVYDKNAKPLDVLGDVVSHHLVNVDPKIKQTYSDFVSSIQPWQEDRLREQYEYAKAHEHGDETNSYEQWKQDAGLPAYFRGYPFQQWPGREDMYTGDQLHKLDAMMEYLKGAQGPGAQPSMLVPVEHDPFAGQP